jgi:hypothetical protein
MLVTTHYMSEAEHCDHLALMFAGRVVADASPQQMKQQVLAEAGQLYRVYADNAAALVAPLQEAGFANVSPYGTPACADAGCGTAAAGAAGWGAAAAAARPIAMEDVFVQRVSQLEAQNATGEPAMNLHSGIGHCGQGMARNRARPPVLHPGLCGAGLADAVVGYGLSLDVENIPFAVVDHDRSAASRDYAYRFIDSRYFQFRGYAGDERDAAKLIGSGAVRVVLVIPPQFGKTLARAVRQPSRPWWTAAFPAAP